jgi:hypothetical protein
MPLPSCMVPGPAIGIARTVCFHVNEQPVFAKRDGIYPIVARSGALVRSSLGPIVRADLLATAEWSMLRSASRLLEGPHVIGARLPQDGRLQRVDLCLNLGMARPQLNAMHRDVELCVDVVEVMTSWWNWPPACSISGPQSRRAPQSTMEPKHLA